jgi:hypothetical protein
MGWYGMDWIDLAQNWSLVTTTLNFELFNFIIENAWQGDGNV